jgi:hypothetical protein
MLMYKENHEGSGSMDVLSRCKYKRMSDSSTVLKR